MSKSVQGYADQAAALLPRFNGLSSDEIYEHVRHLFPAPPARALDVGAGSGRDAAWLFRQGYDVTAVEPVAEFVAGARKVHGNSAINWVQDSLPVLTSQSSCTEPYDLIILCAVWQHLDQPSRAFAMPVLAGLLAKGGRLVISVRHGPGVPARPVYACTDDEVLMLAQTSGLDVVHQQARASVQSQNNAIGVSWTWFVFERS